MIVYRVDTFTSMPFGGNPAAVCLLGEATVDDAWMQQVAAELNQPTTAFLASADGRLQLRWFTPAQELPLCGHATLATAHVLYDTGQAGHDQVLRFSTGNGTLPAWQDRARIWMDFPAAGLTEGAVPREALAAVGCSAPLSLQVIGGTLGTGIAAWWRCRLVSAGGRAGRGAAAAGWPGNSASRSR